MARERELRCCCLQVCLSVCLSIWNGGWMDGCVTRVGHKYPSSPLLHRHRTLPSPHGPLFTPLNGPPWLKTAQAQNSLETDGQMNKTGRPKLKGHL